MHSDADNVKWVFRFAVERQNFVFHCTAMLPIAIVATAYMDHGDKALAFFGGDTLNLRARVNEFWGIDFPFSQHLHGCRDWLRVCAYTPCLSMYGNNLISSFSAY